MIQALLQHSNIYPLHISKGKAEYEQQLSKLAALAWQITYTALYNGEQFSATEIEKAKELIAEYIRQQTNPVKAYAQLVQRVLLARNYIHSHPGTYAPPPATWFCPANKKGYTGTAQWFTMLEQTRAAMPLYKQALKAFPEAIVEVTSSGKAADFHYWRSYFAQLGDQPLLNLFLSTLANGQYQ